MPAKKGKKQSRTTPRAIATDMKRAQALELRTHGWTYAVIAKELNVSTTRAHQLVDEALKARVWDPIEKYRHLAMFRAEIAMTQTFPLVAAGDQAAITNWLAIEARLDKLTGITGPAEAMDVNVSGHLAKEIVVTFVHPPPREDPMQIEHAQLNGHANGKGNGHG